MVEFFCFLFVCSIVRFLMTFWCKEFMRILVEFLGVWSFVSLSIGCS